MVQRKEFLHLNFAYGTVTRQALRQIAIPTLTTPIGEQRQWVITEAHSRLTEMQWFKIVFIQRSLSIHFFKN